MLLIDAVKDYVNLTNLFNGNEFLERTGLSVINQNIKMLSRPLTKNSLIVVSKIIQDICTELFINTTRSQFDSYFPESSDFEVDEKVDISSLKNHMKPPDPLSEIKLLQNRVDNLYFYATLATIIIMVMIIVMIINYIAIRKHRGVVNAMNVVKSEYVTEKLISK